jgi:hypothetical protein
LKILESYKTKLGFPVLVVEPDEDGSIYIPAILVELGWFKSRSEAFRAVKAGALRIKMLEEDTKDD